MSAEKAHIIARKMQEYQRLTAKIYACGLCAHAPAFATEAKLWEHAAESHPDSVGTSRESKAFKDYATEAAANQKYVHYIAAFRLTQLLLSIGRLRVKLRRGPKEAWWGPLHSGSGLTVRV